MRQYPTASTWVAALAIILLAVGCIDQYRERQVERHVAALADSSAGIRSQAAAALVDMGVAAVPPLAVRLSDPSMESALRAGIATVLGEIGGAEAATQLAQALADSSSAVSASALASILQIGPAAVEPLLASLAAADDSSMDNLITALALVGDSRAAGPLAGIVKEEISPARERAANALGRLGVPGREALLPLLDYPNVRVRTAAVVGLGQTGDSASVAPLCKLLAAEKDDTLLVAVAALALGKLGPPAVKCLLQALDNDATGNSLIEHWTVQDHVVLALGRTHDERALERLLRLVRSPDTGLSTAIAAILALGEDGSPTAVAELVDIVVQTSRPGHTLLVYPASTALGRVGAEAVGPLLGALRQLDRGSHQDLYRVFAQVGHPAVAPLIQEIGDADMKAHVVRAFGWIEDPDAVEPLVAILENRAEDEHLRTNAAISLSHIDAPGVSDVLRAASNDSSSVVRRQARRQLAMLAKGRTRVSIRKLGEADRSRSLPELYASALELAAYQRQLLRNPAGFRR